MLTSQSLFDTQWGFLWFIRNKLCCKYPSGLKDTESKGIMTPFSSVGTLWDLPWKSSSVILITQWEYEILSLCHCSPCTDCEPEGDLVLFLLKKMKKLKDIELIEKSRISWPKFSSIPLFTAAHLPTPSRLFYDSLTPQLYALKEPHSQSLWFVLEI